MLERTLLVLGQVGSIATTLVVSRDRRVLGLAQEQGARALAEHGGGGLNAALRQATLEASRAGADAVLVVPVDLTLVEPSEIEALVERGRRPPVVVLAPDRFREGTNALLAAPPGLIQYGFGPSSFPLHAARARAAGARLEIYETPGLGLDIDGPEDLQLALDPQRQAPRNRKG
jgi:2-phospho-L-lactate guanylyltransferase